MVKQAMGRTEIKQSEQLSTRPGKQVEMNSKPASKGKNYKPAGKLKGKVAIITGGDSGIGRAVAIAFAQEGADVTIIFLNEEKDAAIAKSMVENEGARCLAIKGDIGDKDFCQIAVNKTVNEFGRLDILVNNAGEQHPKGKPEDISAEQLERTFRTNVFGMFYLTQAALKHIGKGGAVINTTSVTAYKGHPTLLDYSSSKGAILAYSRTLSQMLAERGIRVNAVAPGPIWTPLIPSTFPKDEVKDFGKNTALGRPGQPEELAPAYVFLASDDSSYMTGQTMHINGGTIVNG
ncbi:MAG TPA: SDR family oxidoreductase [Candidatus Saccharimonadales bacterium]|nr:SDR family oxidoreductase [Candidatus Saccharimonadales bacterium]